MKLGRARTASVVGIIGKPVLVEVALLKGLPAFTIVGLPDTAVCESRERIRAAFAAAGIAFPNARVTVNLSPASTPKVGTAFDLAIAVAILAALAGREADLGLLYLGELGLDGSVRPVRGILPAALAAIEDMRTGIVVPPGQGQEAAMAGIEASEVRHVGEIAENLGVSCAPVPSVCEVEESNPVGISQGGDEIGDMADVRGQSEAKLALEVACAGGHHVLMMGPPGVGKSLLASRLPGIMPPLERSEGIEVASILSCLGEFDGKLPTRAPFASPHHSTSSSALVGGGSIPRPGAISRAHCGVLFLDELPEFPSSSLQALRQPMESGIVEIFRARASLTFPARFQLIAAANPCKCGRAFDGAGACSCSPRERRDYFRRIGGPLLDRFDLNLCLGRLSAAQLKLSAPGETSAQIAERIREARERSRQRYNGQPWSLNAQAPSRWLRHNTVLPAEVGARFDRLLSLGRISMRGFDKILRLAWTHADLAGRAHPASEDFQCAFTYREESFHV